MLEPGQHFRAVAARSRCSRSVASTGTGGVERSSLPLSRAAPAVIRLPRPDGELVAFEFLASPVMEPALAAKFPEITTYAGHAVDDPSVTVRFDLTPKGFHAQVLDTRGRRYIDPRRFSAIRERMPATSGVMPSRGSHASA